MVYPARIINKDGGLLIQSLEEHLLAVASLSAESLKKVNLEKTGYLCGLLHDMGKYTKRFKEYIEKSARGEDVKRGSVNHSFAAVIFVLERWHDSSYDADQIRSLTAELIAYAIGAHHGEFDVVGREKNGFCHRLEKNRTELHYDKAVQEFTKNFSLDELDKLFNSAVSEIEKIVNVLISLAKPLEKKNRALMFYFGLLARLILSALVDADRQDAAEFAYEFKLSSKSTSRSFWQDNFDYYENKISKFKPNTPINKARCTISDQCLKKAFEPEGIYRLNVSTGGGKTLSTLRYALAHNLEHEKDRAIFIIPLLSVLEQNAAEISDYIKNKEALLEHHSNIVQEKEKKSEHDELEGYEILSETWSRPLVISTLVQLLNILFSHKITDIRRMISFINSSIVLDEVQSLPIKTIHMFSLAMNFLSAICKTTVVMSSATQPSFDSTAYPINFSQNADIVSLNEELQKPFARTHIVNKCTKYGMSEEELELFAEEVSQNLSSLLLICNKKEQARNMFEKLKRLKKEEWNVFHLSTSMCVAHRRAVFNEIKKSLESKTKKTLCVSTQLVEAGIDFSFEGVIRVLAGLDNHIQAAGRCNRNWEFSNLCTVYIVNLKEENLRNLKEIKIAQRNSEALFENFEREPERFQNDLQSQEAISVYYSYLFGRKEAKDMMSYPLEKKSLTLFELLADNPDWVCMDKDNYNFCLSQAFFTANKSFKVFDDNTIDVIVPYREGEKIIADLNSERAKYDMKYIYECLDRAKPYVISIFEYTKNQLEELGYIHANEKIGFYELNSLAYDESTGLNINPNLNF